MPRENGADALDRSQVFVSGFTDLTLQVAMADAAPEVLPAPMHGTGMHQADRSIGPGGEGKGSEETHPVFGIAPGALRAPPISPVHAPEFPRGISPVRGLRPEKTSGKWHLIQLET